MTCKWDARTLPSFLTCKRDVRTKTQDGISVHPGIRRCLCAHAVVVFLVRPNALASPPLPETEPTMPRSAGRTLREFTRSTPTGKQNYLSDGVREAKPHV